MATTATAPEKVTADSILWAHAHEGNIVCETHAPHSLHYGPWERMTPQEILQFQEAVSDIPLWGDYPCDGCRAKVDARA